MNRKISINITDATNKTWEFEGLKEFFFFLKEEQKYWQEKRASLPEIQSNVHQYLNAQNILSQVVTTIGGWESSALASWDEEQLNQQLRQLIHNQGMSSQWLWSGHAFSNQYVECQKQYGDGAATSFVDLIIRKQITNISNNGYFFGVMLAYEFLNQDSDLTKRSKGEEASLEYLRDKLDITTTQLVGEVESFKDDFIAWDGEIKNGWQDWLINTSKDHGDSQKSYKDQFNEFMDERKNHIANLENTYEDKLRLEKPATYWKDAANKYGIHGGLWAIALVATVLLGIVYFSEFFNSWLNGQKIGVNLNTIQGLAIFGSILAVFAFLVRTLSRLAFSSYHLMRDAQERELLTYLYLSLHKDKEIDESSRNIILQALFSRSETGLLVTESGPAMPGIGELIKPQK